LFCDATCNRIIRVFLHLEMRHVVASKGGIVKLLTAENAKTTKGELLGFLTGILYLAPHKESGVMNTCPMSSPGCRAACLYTAGRAGIFPMVNAARKRKTLWLARDRDGFLRQLRKDIRSLIARARRQGLIPAVRVNGTSDLPWLALQMAREFPDVQFYDYTKLPRPWLRQRENYSLTFSLSENNAREALDALQWGINVAVVFHVKRGQPLPEIWNGFHVVDGDSHDLRFLDRHRFGLVIGLRAKGRARQDTSGFVQIALTR
jgi:hypothetical protein